MKYNIFDSHLHKVTIFEEERLDEELAKIKTVIEKHLNVLGTAGQYKLDSFEVTIALKANALVFSADGGITLKFSGNGSQKQTAGGMGH